VGPNLITGEAQPPVLTGSSGISAVHALPRVRCILRRYELAAVPPPVIRLGPQKISHPLSRICQPIGPERKR